MLQQAERLPENVMFSFLFRGSSRAVFLRACAMIAAIAFADWWIKTEIPLGFLYLFPMLLAGSILNRWQIAATAALCMFLTEEFDTFGWSPAIGIPRDVLIFAAFAGAGLLIHELVHSRQLTLLHLQRIENEIQSRKEADEQLRHLVESSPVAIFIAESEGTVLLANDAFHRLIDLLPGTLPGKSIREYLPSLLNVPAPDQDGQRFRTVMHCNGKRQNGESFVADVWFSTYRTSKGSRLAAMVIDTSEESRSKEDLSLPQVVSRNAPAVLLGIAAERPRLQEFSSALTVRESAVLKGVFEGLSNKEIAAQLKISESSVKAALQQLFDKTGVRTRSQLVRIALEWRAERRKADNADNV